MRRKKKESFARGLTKSKDLCDNRDRITGSELYNRDGIGNPSLSFSSISKILVNIFFFDEFIEIFSLGRNL